MRSKAWGGRTAYIERAAHAFARHSAILGGFSAALAFARETAKAQIRNCHFKMPHLGAHIHPALIAPYRAVFWLFSSPPQRAVFICFQWRAKQDESLTTYVLVAPI